MEHLFNCHGEWTLFLSLLAAIPFMGPWLRAHFAHGHAHKDGK